MNKISKKTTLMLILYLLTNLLSIGPVLADKPDPGDYFYPSYAAEITEELANNESTSAPQNLQYEIRPGDTLYKIARSFDISLQTLLDANPMDDPNRLSVGQLLSIPATEAGIVIPEGYSNVVNKVMTSTLTAYTAGIESTGKTPDSPEYGITFSGNKAEEGRTVAVDPSIIPIGSTVYIDGVGLRTAEDTGSAIRGPRIDVFMNNLDQAKQFGVKKNVKVYILASDSTRL